MTAPGARACVAVIAAVVGSSCNGQFDFDKGPLDAGAPPIIIVEGGPEDTSSPGLPDADAPRTGVHIACGGSDCLTPGCCSTSAGFTCVDIGQGGTCGGLLIQCDDTADCPAGQVCCAEGDNRALLPCSSGAACVHDGLQRVHCEPESRCKAPFVMLCDPDRPSPCTQCIATSLAGLPPSYHQCAATP